MREKGTWKQYIEDLKEEFIGKYVMYNKGIYQIVMVDYNGIIHIDKPTERNKTTAVYEAAEARNKLVDVRFYDAARREKVNQTSLADLVNITLGGDYSGLLINDGIVVGTVIY